MEKLFAHDETMHARFPTKILFADFSDRDLEGVFAGLMERCGRDLQLGVAEPVAAQYVGKNKPTTPADKPPDYHVYLERRGESGDYFYELSMHGGFITRRCGRSGEHHHSGL